MIARITRLYLRLYTESGQIMAYVDWIDETGRPGRTEGSRRNLHMIALANRAAREGVRLEREVW